MSLKPSLRLEKIISYITKDSKVLDIGTDHAIIPISLLSRKITNKVIASEVVEGPYNVALTNIKNAGFENDIKLIYSNGVESIDNPNWFDFIVIAGMGGNTISEILNQKKLKLPKLILHPTNNEYNLRKTLSKKGYKIVDEVIIVEGKINNVIIYAERKVFSSYLNDFKKQFGPILIQKANKDSDVRKYFTDRKEKYLDIYNKSKKEEYLKLSNQIDKILNNKI